MNGRERIAASLQMEQPDRVPVFPLAHYWTAGLKRLSIREFATSADKMAGALLAGYERFGWDGINPGSDVAVEGEALGSVLDYPEDGPPYVVRPALMEPESLDRLKRPNPLRDGRMPVVVRATKLCVKEAGSEAYIGPFIMGPLNCASQVRGVENLLMDTIERPAFVGQLLDFSTELLIDYGKAMIDVGAHAVFLGEALCSPGMISPEFYRKTVVPRQQRLTAALKAYGAVDVLLHVCGNVRRILPTMLETGCNIIDLDWKVEMSEAKRTCAGKAAIRGNLDPAAVLLQGTPDLVYERAMAVIREAGAGGGLILGSGCDVAPGTPAENLEAMIRAAQDAKRACPEGHARRK